MIRFLTLSLTNFHLIRSLEIPFSCDPAKPLSVIRAEPGTGKTTIFRAFRWAIYGEAGLPNEGKAYDLGRMDHDPGLDGPTIEVAVAIEFERDNRIGSPTRYRLERRTTERVSPGGRHDRDKDVLTLMQHGPGGWLPADNVELKLDDWFAPELKDVFFTDGDETMRFIDRNVSTSTKRERVRGAIKNLLGLNVLEIAGGHLDQVARQLNSEVKAQGASADLQRASEEVDRLTKALEAVRNEEQTAEHNVQEHELKLAEIRQKLTAALIRGDRRELSAAKASAEATLKLARQQTDQARKEKGELLKTRDCSLPLISATLDRARGRLQALHDQGEIPQDYAPLLTERLHLGRCICGASLEPGTEHRARVEAALAAQAAATPLKDRLTRLHFGGALSGVGVRPLEEQLETLEKRLLDADRLETDQRARIRQLELQIDQLGDADVDLLRAVEEDHNKQLLDATQRRGSAQGRARSYETQLSDQVRRRDLLMKNESKARSLAAKLLINNDLAQVVAGARGRIQSEKLVEVSDQMNALFRPIVGLDDESGLIKRTEITPDFDVVVLTQTGAKMDPDLQLSGAMKRALTVSFILALADVSGVRQPNVIDTPLSAMGIQVKQAALRTILDLSSQPILFLTFAEIRDIEPILDRYCGEMVTLTFTDHYPRYVKNKPPVDTREVLLCRCRHGESCDICERTRTSADEEGE